MLRNLALTLFMALPLVGTAHAAPPTREELLTKAAQGAAVCAKEMPDSRDTSRALVANGFKMADADGPFKAYSALGNRVVVLITTPSNRKVACLVAVSKMSEAEALQLISPWLRLANAKPIPLKPNARVTHAWLGVFKKSVIDLAITPNDDLYYFTGRAIVAREVLTP
ncbi:hypothetical protein [Paracoccus aminophilus]|uniref:Uncharacterized protein n=1 Tax=Paracoccus aminophilus JCM 7686 TaxID=1367847 RepID=S5XWI8_PARAH|nr:hypothetical protein [Paracoccus aminophilus]AGT09647.1 hypothetical protein JCM7686_2579 [Paracoccus aminophilus JCM 7686]